MRGKLDPRIAAGDRDRRRQIAAGAVAGHADARAVAAELGNAREHVAHGGEGVLERAGKARFRRAPVIDRYHHGAGLDREQPGLPVMGFEIAGDPAAAVEKHHGRRFRIRHTVDARGERPGRALHFRIDGARDRRRRNRGARGGQRAERIAGALRRHGLGIAQRQFWNDLGNDGIERCDHGVPRGRNFASA